MNISKVSQTGTVISGGLSVNLGQPIMGLCRQVIVEPVNAVAVYTMEIINGNSETIYKRESETGSLVENIALPLIGMYTMKISSATVDGIYDFRLMMQQ